MCSTATQAAPPAAEWVAQAGLGDLLEAAERLLRRVDALPLGGAVSDTALRTAGERLHRLEQMAHAQKLRVVAEVHERTARPMAGAASGTDYLKRMGMTRGEAAAQADTAVTVLSELPRTGAVLREGKLGAGQAQVVTRKLEEVKQTAGAQGFDVEQVQAKLDTFIATELAGKDRYEVARGIDEFVHTLGVNVLADRENRAWRRRGLRIWTDAAEGWVGLEGRFDPVRGATIKAAVEALAKPDGAGDERTPAQRQADALADLAKKFLDDGTLPDVATQRPHVLLYTNPGALHGVEGAEPSLLDGYGPVSDAMARQICCDADVTLVVSDKNGRPIDAKPLRPRPTRRQRLTVVARDQVCIGCGANATRCQIHHIKWRSKGGPTVVPNLTLVCWSCHRNIHHHGWEVTRDEFGRYRAGPPRQEQSPPGPDLWSHTA